MRNVRLGRRESERYNEQRKKLTKNKKVYQHHSLFHSVNRKNPSDEEMVFHVFFKNRWGRGQPDDIGAINLGDEKFDPDSDKKPRAGQILWIRGLTRLQTQVTIPISLSFSLFLSIFLCHSVSLSHSLIISSFNKIQYSLDSSLFTKTEIKPNKKKKIRKNTAPGSSGSQGGETHTSHIRSSLERFMKFSGLFSLLSPYFPFF